MTFAVLIPAMLAAALTTVPLPPEKPEAIPEPPVGEQAIASAAVPLPPARPSRSDAREANPVPETPPTSRAADPVPGIAGTGFVCRDPRLAGRPLPNFVASRQSCGILDPVEIHEIAGVRLSSKATLNCPTARRVADWLSGVAQPAAKARLGAPIREIWVMGSYSCRTRNHRPGARISEHGKGRAIDIGGVTLGNGQRLTVRNDWNNGERGAFLREVHGKACGLFHTVLGPKADRHHQDHFHFDTAQRGGRPYCR